MTLDGWQKRGKNWDETRKARRSQFKRDEAVHAYYEGIRRAENRWL